MASLWSIPQLELTSQKKSEKVGKFVIINHHMQKMECMIREWSKVGALKNAYVSELWPSICFSQLSQMLQDSFRAQMQTARTLILISKDFLYGLNSSRNDWLCQNQQCSQNRRNCHLQQCDSDWLLDEPIMIWYQSASYVFQGHTMFSLATVKLSLICFVGKSHYRYFSSGCNGLLALKVVPSPNKYPENGAPDYSN